MAISYQAALRVYAKKHGKFIVPKKGSPEYEEIRKIMGETEMSAEHEIKRRSKKTKVSEANIRSDDERYHTSEKATKKAHKLAVKKPATSENSMLLHVAGMSEVPPPMKSDTKMIDDPVDEIGGKKIVKKTLKPKKEVKGKGVNRTGKTSAENYADMLVNSNTGPSAEISAEFPDQKEKIKKAIKKGKGKDAMISVVANPPDKTIKNMKTDDKVAIEGEAVQFSFQALRNRLGA